MANSANVAKSYVVKGISIIPLVPGGKKPLVAWAEYQKRPPTEAELESWFSDGKANLGAVCGAVSGGLVALDFEDRVSFERFFNKAILNATLVVKTPHGGVHVWLKETGEVPRRSIRISKAPALDLLGEGGYGVLPPSRIDHTKCDKTKCSWKGWGQYEITSSTDEIMPTKGVFEFVMRRCRQLGWDLTETRPRVEEILPGVSVGMRNSAAFQYARYLLFKVKLDPTAVMAELKRWNQLNNPPLLEDELETVWRSAQRYPFASVATEEEPIVLSHLNQIEDPELAGRSVVVEAVVSSTSLAYLSPKEVEAAVEDEDGVASKETRKIDNKDPLNLKLVGCGEDVKYRRLKRLFETTSDLNIKEKSFRTVYLVRVRPPVFTLEKRGEKIVDEKGFEYKVHDIYITSDKPLVFQASSLVRFEGIPMPNPRTQRTTLLAYKVEFLEEARTFDAERLRALKTKWSGLSVRERVSWILDNFEVYSHIVGRRSLIFVDLLCFFTPTRVKLSGEVQRGWGNVICQGDTTTAKTETVKKIIALLKAGMIVTAETASVVGLTGTATQLEKEGWFVEWGLLVLCDRKLLAVDGAHKLSAANWASLAESERSGVVTIAKAAKASAYARTRQIKVANAVDPEANKYKTQGLKNFLYPCQALPTILDETSIARLDLAVFAGQKDVPPEQINRKSGDDYDKDLEILAEELKWCWSDSAGVRFTDEALDYLLQQATELYKTFFCETVPLTSIDLKWKLARLSVALAFLTLSTEDFSAVTVTKEHVEVVVDSIKEEYAKVGLNILAQQLMYEVLDKEDVKIILMRITVDIKDAVDEEVLKEILRYIVTRGRITKDELMTRFSLAEKNQVRPLLGALSGEGLIKQGRGYYPEPKLIEAYKVTEGFRT